MGETIIKSLYDFRKVQVPQKLLELEVSEEAVARELAATAERFLTIETVTDGIRAGDIVQIQFPGEEAGQMQIMQINMGLGFAGKALEDGLLGLRRGDEKVLPVENRRIPVQVVSVKRRKVPELTDELIGRLGLENIKTVVQYREYTVGRIAQRAAQGKSRALCDFAIKSVLEHSEFEPITEENQVYHTLLLASEKQVRDMAAQTGEPEEKILAQAVGMEGKPADQCWQALREECRRQVKLAAVGQAYGKKRGVIFTKEDAARQFEAYAPQLGEAGEKPADETMLELYLMQMYIEYCRQTIAKYYENQYRIVLVP